MHIFDSKQANSVINWSLVAYVEAAGCLHKHLNTTITGIQLTHKQTGVFNMEK